MTENALKIDSPDRYALKPNPFHRWARSLVRSRLATIRDGRLTVVERDRTEHFGEPDAALRATVYVDDPSFYQTLLLRGSIGGAESYMDGMWHSDDLTALVRILALNLETFQRLERGLARLARPSLALFHAMRSNTRAGSRRNIAAHYDLGNEFFELFLDPTLTYSSGVFQSDDVTMEEASVAKYERICEKLRIGPDDHVLEIGTGWGGFALHAGSRHGCRVTTTTISRKQHEVACRRVAEAGLSDRVKILLEDYRDLSGEFDKLVSIEMIEAVGHRHLATFFRTCAERLKPTGTMLLQAITIGDRDFEAHTRSVDFVKRYIFPGGELVSLGAVSTAVASQTDLRMTHLEDMTPHYAETLRRWRRRFTENLPQIRALGLGERFLRMWEYYLCYCEGGFEERQIGLVQTVFEKPNTRRPSVLGTIA